MSLRVYKEKFLEYNDYFDEYEIKSKCKKEFISLWLGWLGVENYYKLDEVTEEEWSRFNGFIYLLSKKYTIFLVDCEKKSFIIIKNIKETFSNYEQSMNKTPDKFSYYFIPKLECIINEDWDYTYIISYIRDNTVKKLEPFIKKAKLYHFK